MMADFDPDAYLASKAQSGDFDPDAYLKAKDPNAYDTDKDYEPNNRLDRLKAKAKAAYRELSTPDNKFTSAQPVEKVAKGIGETALEGATGLAGTVAGGLAGIGSTVGNTAMGVAQGTPLKEAFQSGLKAGSDAVQGVSSAMTYQPKTATGKLISELSASPMDLAKEISGAVGGSITSGMAGQTLPAQPVAGPNAVPLDKQREAQRQFQLANGGGGEALGRTMGEAAATVAPMALGKKPVEMARAAEAAKAPVMPGMGAADTSMEAQRRERFASLPVPLNPTKGQLSRDFEQKKFENETAKHDTLGKPLRERIDDNNKKFLKNFDAMIDLTGAEQPSVRPVNKVVSDALFSKAASKKAEVNAAYKTAEKAGAMNAPVDITPLKEYLDHHQDDAELVNVLRSTKAKMNRMSTGGGRDVFGQAKPRNLTVGQLEIIRKGVNRLSQKDATEGLYAGDVRKVIDGMTEGKGGQEYRTARSLRSQYAKEFEDVGVINDLIKTKPNTIERANATESAFKNMMLSSSLPETKHVRRVLQTAGEDGEQAWKELQGQTVRHIKDEITKNLQRNEKGMPVASASKLNTLVDEFDKNGKLDFIFGKKGAQTIRDINEASIDLYTSPANTANYSNTASVLLGILDAAVIGGSHGLVPVPVASILHQAHRARKSAVTKRRVKEALGPEPKAEEADPLGLLKEESSETK